MRTVIGLAVAPIGAVVTVAGCVWLILSWDPWLVGIWVAMLAYPAEMLVGFPGHLLLTRRQLRSRYAYAMLGASTGLFVVLAIGVWRNPNWREYAGVVTIAGVAGGVVAALIFWSLVVSRREQESRR